MYKYFRGSNRSFGVMGSCLGEEATLLVIFLMVMQEIYTKHDSQNMFFFLFGSWGPELVFESRSCANAGSFAI